MQLQVNYNKDSGKFGLFGQRIIKKPQLCLFSFGGGCLMGLYELRQVSCRTPMRMMNQEEYFNFLFMIQKKNCHMKISLGLVLWKVWLKKTASYV